MWEHHEYEVKGEPVMEAPDAAGRLYLIKPHTLKLTRFVWSGGWMATVIGVTRRRDGEQPKRGYAATRSITYHSPDFDGAPTWVVEVLMDKGLLP